MILKLGSQDWMRHRERIYAARRKRIRDVCDKYDNPRKRGNGKQFMFDLKHRLAACLHAKVYLTDTIFWYTVHTAYRFNVIVH